ncbi:MAG: phosphoribosylamine--glycine ligase [Alphaproteobacteria bacterium]|nr:phosphoribosylamine--glycine ligase [Alphaproteobacteria bacterium]
MKVLLVGGGAREHALAWAIAQSADCEALYCAPGNAGIESFAECVPIAIDDVEALTLFAQEKAIDLVVVGPEAPLVKGLADKLRDIGIAVFGPSANAARLEGSKGFMKDLCAQQNIPTARYQRFTDPAAADAFIETLHPPIVVKADGLAAGKGVVIAQTKKEARRAAHDMLSGNAFGAAGTEIVIEEFLDGEELSYFVLTDGVSVLPLASAQDHKRAYDHDQGPNTGGMGAYAPAHLMTPELEQKILERIIQPTIEGLAAIECPYIGVLYAGIMVVKDEPYLIEYNVRFGDPECQVIIPRLQGDWLEIFAAAANGWLESVKENIRWRTDTALCVVMAAQGYPGEPMKNTTIKNLEVAQEAEDVIVFHAATRRADDGTLRAMGGRVLGITAMGADVAQARDKAYKAVDMIDWPEGFCRRDIGWRALPKA